MVPTTHKNFIDKTVEVLKEDPRIIGIAAAGSYLEGDMDEYSDIDLIIAVEPEKYEEVMSERLEIAGKLGILLSAFSGEHVREPRLLICLYGLEPLHVDLKFVSIKDIAKRVEDPHILWQKENCISEALKTENAKFPTPNIQWMEDRFWVWIHYGAAKIGRGEIFETIDFLSALRQMVLGPLILMKTGKQPRGVRKIDFIAPEYVSQLKKTIPSYNKESCIKATNAAIKLYLELRDHFITEDFVKREEAQKNSIDYLNKIKR